jgi:hypothetical protein
MLPIPRNLQVCSSTFSTRASSSLRSRRSAVTGSPRIELVDNQNLSNVVDHRLGAQRVPSPRKRELSLVNAGERSCGAIFSWRGVSRASRCWLPDSQTKRRLQGLMPCPQNAKVRSTALKFGKAPASYSGSPCLRSRQTPIGRGRHRLTALTDSAPVAVGAGRLRQAE